MPIDQPRWYLVRTRQYKEKCVNEALSKLLPDTFLPFLRTSRRIRGQIVSTARSFVLLLPICFF